MNHPSTKAPSARPGSSYERELAELYAWIEATPSSATVKGMYIDSVLTIASRSGVQPAIERRYFTFKDYPLRDMMRLVLELVPRLYPHATPREGVRELGRAAFPTLSRTTIGKVLFSVAGPSFEQTLALARKAWEVSLRPGTATLVRVAPGRATIEMRDVWNFTDCYQVGIFEGVLNVFGLRGRVWCEQLGRLCDANIHLEWEVE